MKDSSMIREEIRKLTIDSIRDGLGVEIPEFAVSVPENSRHGDYSTNAAFALSKILKKTPLEAAEILCQKMSSPIFSKIEAVPPGFVNFFIRDDYLLELLAGVAGNPLWWRSEEGKGKTVIVEYFQLNVAKMPHIGHLRSAVIGDSIKRMLKARGYNTVSDTHLGDWGTQFGMLLLGYEMYPELREKITDHPSQELTEMYVRINRDMAERPELLEAAKKKFAELEAGDPECREVWKWMVEVSKKEFRRIAGRLCLESFDLIKGESDYEAYLPLILEEATAKGIARKKNGALITDLSNFGLDEAVLRKSDGASTYLLRDLAALKYRREEFNFFQNIYVVDVRQEHHFRQLFKTAELLGYEGAEKSRHVEFGYMSSKDGALSTRKGEVISLEAVLDEAKTRALAVIKEKNPELDDKERVAESIGLGALKYFDLSRHRKSDIVFEWDKALAFEGNTGPYLQYTHARLKSILRKTEPERAEAYQAGFGNIQLDELEHRILAATFRLPEAIEDALVDYTPNTLANYLYELAGRANEFYHSHPVVQETDRKKRFFLIMLTDAVAHAIGQGLHLLGIESPEKM